MPVFGVIVFCALFFASCKKEYSDEQGITVDSSAVARTIMNQAYGTNAAQTADLYLPAKRTDTTKVLILLHGGFWSSGDKADLDSAVLVLQSLYPALAIVNTNYRLVVNGDVTTQFPTQMTDINLLLNYLTTNKDSLKISTKYALAGVSAGGQLALEYAYAYDTTKRIKVVGGIVPPTNFIDPYYYANPAFQLVAVPFIGQPINDTAAYVAASPAQVITAAAPPSFVSFGGLDPYVPTSSDSLLFGKFKSLGLTYSFTIYGGEGHVFTTPKLLDTLTQFVAFLKSYL